MDGTSDRMPAVAAIMVNAGAVEFQCRSVGLDAGSGEDHTPSVPKHPKANGERGKPVR